MEQAEIAYDGDNDPASSLESAADRALDHHESRLMRIPGVEGVGVEEDRGGVERIVIYIRDGSVRGRLPLKLAGIPVRVEVSGEFEAQ